MGSIFDEETAGRQGRQGGDGSPADGREADTSETLDSMRSLWEQSSRAGAKKVDHEAKGCGKGVGFEFQEGDDTVPGTEEEGTSAWKNTLKREGKLTGRPVLQFDKTGKPTLNR